MVCVAGIAVTAYLCVYLRPTGDSMLLLFEDHYSGTFCDDEALTAGIEGQ